MGGASCARGAAADAGTAPEVCASAETLACYLSFRLDAGAVPPQPGVLPGVLHYYASAQPDATGVQGPTAALIAIHGRPRDANKTFDAALLAVQEAGVAASTLVVAPVFQVAQPEADRCRTPGVPAARPDEDLLWTCASWMEGGAANGGLGPSSFAVLDALVAETVRRWPTVRVVTIAGFSAGAQMVQHAIGFAAPSPAGVHLRYVVADPGTWLYFDPVRPQPMPGSKDAAHRSPSNEPFSDWLSCGTGLSAGVRGACRLQLAATAPGCATVNRWKYGTDDVPAALGVAAAARARAHYAAADIHYLEGERDTGTGPGTATRVLDKSCAAMTQGPYRLQRGIGYAFYDQALLAPERLHTFTVVPGCAHDVACVFPSPAGRAALVAEMPADSVPADAIASGPAGTGALIPRP